MKLVIQRVKKASVEVDSEIIGSIGKGLMILVGVGHDDCEKDALALASKTANLRIFEDENGKMNKSLSDVDGGVLSVSQFTLFADCRHGRRPSFTAAGEPVKAKELYLFFNDALKQEGVQIVETGEFGADMLVSLENDGPVTIILDSKELIK